MKDHTIIFVPHTRARFRKVRISSRQIVAGAVVVALLAGLSAFTTWSFFTNTVDRGELVRIRAENEELRLTNRSFETSIQELERELGEYEETSRRLAIVAGLDALDSAPDTGIGGADYGTNLEALSSRSGALAANLSQIGDRLEENMRWRDSMPTTAPVRGVMTSGFGYRSDPVSGRRASHFGVDISTAPGREVVAPAPGLVVKAGRIGGLGNAVVVSHGYGISTRYGHLSRIDVVAGQRIGEGETLGLVGSTGKSTGYHLHYEVRENGRPVNPIYYLLDWPRASGS